jgi:hypothetical protein
MKKPETAVGSGTMRGKYANLLRQGSNVVVLDPELVPYFPDSVSVNRALYAFLANENQADSSENSEGQSSFRKLPLE